MMLGRAAEVSAATRRSIYSGEPRRDNLKAYLTSRFFPATEYYRRSFVCRPHGLTTMAETTVRAILAHCRQEAGNEYWMAPRRKAHYQRLWRHGFGRTSDGAMEQEHSHHSFVGTDGMIYEYTLSLGVEQSEILSVVKPNEEQQQGGEGVGVGGTSALLSVSDFWRTEHGTTATKMKPPAQWTASAEEVFDVSEADGDFLRRCGQCFERPTGVGRFDQELFFQQRYGPTRLVAEQRFTTLRDAEQRYITRPTVTTLEEFLSRKRAAGLSAEYCICRKMEGLTVKKETFGPAWYGNVLVSGALHGPGAEVAAPQALLFMASGEAVNGRIFSLDVVGDTRWHAAGLLGTRDEHAKSGSSWYTLRSFVCKIGGVQGGHYYAVVKYGDDWFRTDDSVVTRLGAGGTPGCAETAHRAVLGMWEKEGSSAPADETGKMAQEPESAEFLAADASTRLASARKWLAYLSGWKAPVGSAMNGPEDPADSEDEEDAASAGGDMQVLAADDDPESGEGGRTSGEGRSGTTGRTGPATVPGSESPPRKRTKHVRFETGPGEGVFLPAVDGDEDDVWSNGDEPMGELSAVDGDEDVVWSDGDEPMGELSAVDGDEDVVWNDGDEPVGELSAVDSDKDVVWNDGDEPVGGQGRGHADTGSETPCPSPTTVAGLDDVDQVAQPMQAGGEAGQTEDPQESYAFDDPSRELQAMEEQNEDVGGDFVPAENNGPISPPADEDGPHHREFDTRKTPRSAQGALLHDGENDGPVTSSSESNSQLFTADSHGYSETHQHSSTGRVHHTGTATFSEGGSSRSATATGRQVAAAGAGGGAVVFHRYVPHIIIIIIIIHHENDSRFLLSTGHQICVCPYYASRY